MTTQTKESIAQKIRDLLARAKRTDSANEAETCLRIAARLADEYALDLLQLEADEPAAEWHWRTLEYLPAWPIWGSPIAGVLYRLHVRVTHGPYSFTCESEEVARLLQAKDNEGLRAVFLDKPVERIRAFGREEHVAIAEYLWVYLCRAFVNAFASRVDRRTPAKAFYHSMALGLIDRIEDERRKTQNSQSNALMISFEQRLDDAIASQGVTRRQCEDPERFSLEAFARGQATPLNMPLPSVRAPLCLEFGGPPR